MKEAFDAVDFGVLIVDPQGRLAFANRWLRKHLSGGEVRLGEPLVNAFGIEVDAHLGKAVRSCLDLGNSVRLSQAFHPTPLPLHRPQDTADARMRQAVDVVGLNPDAGGLRECMVVVRDVTDIVKREQRLRAQSQQLAEELARRTEAHREIERQSLRLREMSRLAAIGLIETDALGHTLLANVRAGELLGLDGALPLGCLWTDALPAADPGAPGRHERWRQTVEAGVRFSDELCLQVPAGRTRWIRLEGGAMRNDLEEVVGHVFTLVDITEFREHAHRIEHLARHDGLTGLSNRAHFDAELHTLLGDVPSAAAEEDGPARRTGLLFIDVDLFKQVNDTHGHAAGDQVLRTVAARIRRCVRQGDLVARLGGDEFGVLLAGVPDDAIVERVAHKIDQAVRLPINIGSCHLHLRVSVGWSVSGPQCADADALVRTADAAMYAVKRARAASEGARVTSRY